MAVTMCMARFQPSAGWDPTEPPTGFHHWFSCIDQSSPSLQVAKVGSVSGCRASKFFAKIKKDQEAVGPSPRRLAGTRSAKALDAALSMRELGEHGARPVQERFVIDCHGRTVNAVYDRVPCLTRTRCMHGG